MQAVLWLLLSIVAYVAGLVVVVRATPRLLVRSFDEVWFMVLAVLDVIGAMMVFGSIVGMLFVFNSGFAVRFFDVLLLLIVLFLMARLAIASFRPRIHGTFRASRILAGLFALFLLGLSVYCIVLLFLLPY